MSRYSSLAPLSQPERGQICLDLCYFFSPSNNATIRSELGLDGNVGSVIPLSIGNYLKWMKDIKQYDVRSKQQRVIELILRLEQSGILIKAGTTGKSPTLSECYYFMHELSQIQRTGSLWLGKALGAEFIGYSLKSILVLIMGVIPEGDIAIGTGILVLPGIILTCRHVLTDMKLDEYVTIGDKKHTIKDWKVDDNVDVGIIYLEDGVEPQLKDIAFRSANDLEEIVIAGHPRVPTGMGPVITLNRGEICGHTDTLDKSSLVLFSAIARPGNSGGPVVGLDGCIVGMISKSLEKNRELVDAMSPIPFFAAIPSDVLRKSFRELTNGLELPWEDYE